MQVREFTESKCVIESARKMTYEELKDITEERRINGKLTFEGTKDVDIWCCAAFHGEEPDQEAIAH